MSKMKKYIYLLTIAVFTLIVVSCSKFVEGYDVSPNSPTDVSIPLLLSSTEMGLETSYTGTLARTSSIFVQQMAGVQFQMLDIASYTLREGDNINDWNNIYDLVLQPCNDIIRRAGTENPYYAGIAKVIKAMALGIATDFWGDVPAREAGTGIWDGNLTPKFDTQSDVIVYIQELLADALTNFSASEADNIIIPGADDIMLQGDIAIWENVTKILQARYANRLSKRDAQGSATRAINFLQGVDNIGDLMAVYGEASNESNQWFAFENTRADYLKTGEFMVNLLQTNNDPRLEFYVAPNASDEYVGASANTTSPDLTASPIGPYIASATAPIPLVTYTEALFIRAEANFRLNNLADAASDYNDAVLSSVLTVTQEDAPPAFVTNFASETAGTITLRKIMEQKYLALFINVEAWSDWRRTGFPILTPNPNGGNGGTAIPRRFPTVQEERNYNGQNAVIVQDIYAPVWWDQ
jgi:hypothetical protein